MTRSFALAAALLAVALPAAAQTESVRFVNRSNETVYRLFSSPTHEGSWRQDLLGDAVMTRGQHLDVTFTNVQNCWYDVMIEFESGATLTDTWDVCSQSRFIIN